MMFVIGMAAPFHSSWWRHQMETFSALLALCAGNSPVPGEFPAQRPVTLSFGVFFDLRLNKRLSKQWWGWWFETLSRPLWRHSNVIGLAYGRSLSRCWMSPFIEQHNKMHMRGIFPNLEAVNTRWFHKEWKDIWSGALIWSHIYNTKQLLNFLKTVICIRPSTLFWFALLSPRE